jgi:glucose/arabinose dehydrogenase
MVRALKLSLISLVVLCASAAVAAPAGAAADGEAAGSGVRLVSLGRFNEPIHVAGAPGDPSRVFVVEQAGVVRVLRNGRRLSRPFLNIRDLVGSGGERGLFSIAFAPDYRTSRRFYVSYTNKAGDSRIDEFRVSSNRNVALRGSRRNVLGVSQPEINHNGGQIAFGPDGLLYIGLGDGGGAGDRHGRIGNGQNLGTLLGKLLRINPRRSGNRPYTVPRSNPFVGRAGARPEIYAYGLRNPWRFSFDRETGALIVADVGQNEWEEIDYLPRGQARGANFGWRAYEGRERFDPSLAAPNSVFPVLVKSHEDGYCSITGGVVVRDNGLPALRGRYVYGDFCRTDIRSVVLGPGRATDDRAVGPRVSSISSFGEDSRGRVYVTSLNSGSVYRLAAR